MLRRTAEIGGEPGEEPVALLGSGADRFQAICGWPA